MTAVNFGATGVEEVLQCVRTILATIRGELFLDRDFGVPGDIVDTPMSGLHRHMSRISAEVERQEPRVKVTRIALQDPGVSDAVDGTAIPGVYVRIREGVLI